MIIDNMQRERGEDGRRKEGRRRSCGSFPSPKQGNNQHEGSDYSDPPLEIGRPSIVHHLALNWDRDVNERQWRLLLIQRYAASGIMKLVLLTLSGLEAVISRSRVTSPDM